MYFLFLFLFFSFLSNKCFNCQIDQKVRINIINFYKDHSLYEKGLKPVVFSEKHFENTKEGWTRFCNDDIEYYKSDYKKLNPFPPNIKNNPEKRMQLEQ